MPDEPYIGSPAPFKEGNPHGLAELLARLRMGSLVLQATILVVIAGVMRIALWPAEVQHDVAMYLQAGQLLVHGARPYVDFVDINPPLITYLSAIPALVAEALHAPLVPTALLLTAAAAAASLATTRRTLVSTFRDAGSDPLLGDVAVLGLACALFFMDLPERLDPLFPGNTAGDPRLSLIFGQREHLFIIGTAPFLALRFQRWERGTPPLTRAFVAGVIASMVTCLKPQLIVVLLLFEASYLLVKRRLSPLWAPELAAFGLVVVAYAAHFALLPTAVKAAWFGRWLPFVVDGYRVFDEPSYLALCGRMWPSLAALVVAFAVAPVDRPLGRNLTRGSAFMSIGGALVYVFQKKGWLYQAFPERTWALVTVLCAAASASALGFPGDAGARAVLPFGRRRVGEFLALLLVLATMASLVSLARINTPMDVDRLRRRSQIMRTIDTFTKEGDAVLVATTSVWDPYPALTLMNRAPGSRYLWLFPIPMMQAVTRGDAEAEFVRDLAEDIQRQRPTLILLQSGRCFGCKSTSVDAFFRGHPPLASALEDYSLRGTVRDGQELQVLVRKVSAAAAAGSP